MSRILYFVKTPALLNELINWDSNEKCENNFVFAYGRLEKNSDDCDKRY